MLSSVRDILLPALYSKLLIFFIPNQDFFSLASTHIAQEAVGSGFVVFDEVGAVEDSFEAFVEFQEVVYKNNQRRVK